MTYRYGIIDASNFFWRCFLDLEDASQIKVTKEGKHISLGTLEVLNRSLEKHKRLFFDSQSELYFLFDNPQSKINSRKEIDAAYKHTREKKQTPRSGYDTLDFWRNLLLYSGSNYYVCYASGLEADDLTLPLLKSLDLSDNSFALCLSNDLDWARNITQKIHWYNWKQSYNPGTFRDEYGFLPSGEAVKLYKTLRGDRSDNIPPGCPYMPEALVLKLVEAKSLSLMLEQEMPPQWQAKLQENRDLLFRNYKLVDFQDKKIKARDFVTKCESSAKMVDHLFTKNGLVHTRLLW